MLNKINATCVIYFKSIGRCGAKCSVDKKTKNKKSQLSQSFPKSQFWGHMLSMNRM